MGVRDAFYLPLQPSTQTLPVSIPTWRTVFAFIPTIHHRNLIWPCFHQIYLLGVTAWHNSAEANFLTPLPYFWTSICQLHNCALIGAAPRHREVHYTRFINRRLNYATWRPSTLDLQLSSFDSSAFDSHYSRRNPHPPPGSILDFLGTMNTIETMKRPFYGGSCSALWPFAATPAFRLAHACTSSPVRAHSYITLRLQPCKRRVVDGRSTIGCPQVVLPNQRADADRRTSARGQGTQLTFLSYRTHALCTNTVTLE